MPFGYDYYEQSERGCKRRRLSSEEAMARRVYEEPKEARDSPADKALLPATDPEPQEEEPDTKIEVETSDRDELIERIKRGERPTWIPRPGLEALIIGNKGLASTHANNACSTGAADHAAIATVSVVESQIPVNETHEATDPIERPRSAFHAGDFHEQSHRDHGISPTLYHQTQSNFSPGFSTSPPPWLSPALHPSLGRARTDMSPQHTSSEAVRRSRAPSLGSSLSSSFVLRVPTSPLVNAVNSTSIDFSQRREIPPLTVNSENGTDRRRTLPPEAFQPVESSYPERRSMNFSRPLPTPSLRREASLPHQTHQPRRSLNSFTYQPASSPHTPASLRSRKSSLGFETSPIQHASMVGSFEESILRGRMSTAPSKPLDFVAQIGVLGKGNCKSSLKCPAHVTVPFPAVFYSYSTMNSSRSPIDDSPSPYVGCIDLEHNLKPIETSNHRKRRHETGQDPEEHMADITAPENTAIGRALARDARMKERRSTSQQAPTGGCYRVPQQGQLQIIIKNPNKTAVKLYLVPYDLEGMEPGTKTFVRQRSFTAGPILETPLTGSLDATTHFDPLKDKHILRYLIHLKFCCPSKGRFYLYDNVRVVFANRVPDGKERLRNEVQLPEPKYSAYKPGKEHSIGSARAKLAAEKAFRRRSSGFGMTSQLYDVMDGFRSDGPIIPEEVPPLPTSAIPFHIAPKSRPAFARSESDKTSTHHQPSHTFDFPDSAMTGMTEADSQAPSSNGESTSRSSLGSSPLVKRSSILWSREMGTSDGRKYSPIPPEPGEGLLSKGFREHKEERGLGESHNESK